MKTPGATMKEIHTAKIPGWGIDANSENDPTYPCRDRSKDDHSGRWVRPAQQQVEVEILQSIEHKQRPAVVGTSTPPAGLSGRLRRAAFRKSESNLLHWMLLLAADRINMVEGVVQDFRRGRAPNLPGELGLRAQWQYNKRGVLLTAAAAIGVIALVGFAMHQAKGRRNKREPALLS
jgi:hypothetical protein